LKCCFRIGDVILKRPPVVFKEGGAEYSGEVAMLFRSKSPLYSGIMRHPPVGA